MTERKAEPGGDLIVYGGLGFVGALLELGLVDEYRVLVHPVLLGRGRGLIDEQAPRLDLAFAGLEALPGGVVVLSYRAGQALPSIHHPALA